MKKYIERYIFDVTRRLPKDIQEEVEKELNSNIYDMLPENPTEEDIDQVLHELGNPRKIANNYKEDKRYVISPLYYDDYIRVLKLVAIIVGVISLVIGAIDSIISVNEPTILESIGYVISRIIGDFISSMVSVFFFVTLIFWAIDHHTTGEKSEAWKLKDLPDLPSPITTRISKTSTMIGLMFHTIFFAIFIIFLLKYVSVTGWYHNDIYLASFFNESVTDQFVIFFIISAVIGFIVYIVQLYEGEWKTKVAICYTAKTIIGSTIGLLFINHPNLISTQFFISLSNTMDVTVEYLKDGLRNILIWITVIVILVSVIDLIYIWLKTLKPKSLKA